MGKKYKSRLKSSRLNSIFHWEFPSWSIYLFFGILSIWCLFIGLEKNIITCFYDEHKSVYNCEMNSKVLFINLETYQFHSVIKADLVIRSTQCFRFPGSSYYMNFIDKNGLYLFVKKLGCRGNVMYPTKGNVYKMASEEVNKVNALFARNENFVYKLPFTDSEYIIMFLITIGLLLICRFFGIKF